MFKKLSIAVLGAVAAFGISSAQAVPVELVTNGDFETGTFAGWTNTGLGSGFGYTINDGTQDPSGPAVPVAPISGNFDAFSSQTGPAQNILSQIISLPNLFSTMTLSWDDRIQNYGGVFSDPNQELRVSLYTAGGVLIGTVFSTNPGDTLIQLGPNARSFDVTGLLLPYAGQNIELRLDQQDNLGFFNATFDNVSLTYVPEPATIGLMGLGLLGLGAMRRRRRA